jgi:hypothetical protein
VAVASTGKPQTDEINNNIDVARNEAVSETSAKKTRVQVVHLSLCKRKQRNEQRHNHIQYATSMILGCR